MNPVQDYVYFKGETFPELPFDIQLSLERVFDFWESKASAGTSIEKMYARTVLDSVSHATILRSPISNMEIVEEYRREIEILLSAMFPEILTNNEIKAASLPFFPAIFNMTSRMKSILAKAPAGYRLEIKGIQDDEIYMAACSFLITAFYRTPVNYKRPLSFDIPDEEKGVIRHYRAFINGEFSQIKAKANTPSLSPEDIQFLMDNSQDIRLWKKMIPPGSYSFEGLALISLFDQTEDEALSELKQLLLEKDALQHEGTLTKLQSHLAQYLGIESVDIGFEAYSEVAGEIRALHGATRPSKLLGKYCEAAIDDCFCDASFETLIERMDSFAVSHVKELQDAPSPVIRRMYEQGVGSFIIAPLRFNDEIIAFLELTSPLQGVLNSMVSSKLRNVLPMFTVAVSRTILQHETELEAIVQDRFTSIHPSVSWKFISAAEQIYQSKVLGQKEEVDEIIFKEVYPLYGQFDIRGSSDARNEAIQADLLEQLELAADVLKHAGTKAHLPICQQLLFRIDTFSQAIRQTLKDGDEVKVLDFLKREFDPVLDYLMTMDFMVTMVNRYKAALFPGLGVIYRQRKRYEETVTMINEQISGYIDQQQVLAQKMFPHYFEKYKTDGVEFNAYIGQSLLQTGTFFPLHLKNLRLWQLILTCGIENLLHANRPELPLPLDISSLILVHSNPLAIRFRMDEKRFDVDGAYNIRYEIVKKRIDKAYIKGTRQRLTQPGKLAIVFSQDWEAEEYLQYIQYLQSIDYLDTQVERVELEDLQGASGLQAFIVGFRYEVSPDVLVREMMQELGL